LPIDDGHIDHWPGQKGGSCAGHQHGGHVLELQPRDDVEGRVMPSCRQLFMPCVVYGTGGLVAGAVQADDQAEAGQPSLRSPMAAIFDAPATALPPTSMQAATSSVARLAEPVQRRRAGRHSCVGLRIGETGR
jgi:hypothetical protein